LPTIFSSECLIDHREKTIKRAPDIRKPVRKISTELREQCLYSGHKFADRGIHERYLHGGETNYLGIERQIIMESY